MKTIAEFRIEDLMGNKRRLTMFIGNGRITYQLTSSSEIRLSLSFLPEELTWDFPRVDTGEPEENYVADVAEMLRRHPAVKLLKFDISNACV